MASNITRRDLLNGIAVAAGGLALPTWGSAQTPLDAMALQTAGSLLPANADRHAGQPRRFL